MLLIGEQVGDSNYALLFGLAALGLGVTSIGFLLIREPPRTDAPERPRSWHTYWSQLTAAARQLETLVTVQLLTACALTSALVPLLALSVAPFGWVGLLPVFFLAGAAVGGRGIGFQSALLDLAPESERPTFAALNAVLVLPVAVLPLLAGVLLQSWPYHALFGMVAMFVTLGAVWTRRL